MVLSCLVMGEGLKVILDSTFQNNFNLGYSNYPW